MEQEDKLKRTADDTANILLEFFADAQQAKDTPDKTRKRTKSVEIVARALLLDGSRQPVTITETEEFVVVELPSGANENKHLSSSACGAEATPVKRPDKLPLSADPGDPPLFSPCSSYPPPTSRMPVHAQSSPTLTSRIVPGCSRSHASSLSQMSTCCPSDPMKMRAKAIADRLKKIGDIIENDQKCEKMTENLATLISPRNVGPSGSIWQQVTTVFQSIYRILTALTAAFGDSRPPDQDPRWQQFSKAWGVLRDDLVPQISSFGGWTAFLRETAAMIVSPRSDDHHMIGSPCLPRTLPISHSTPTCHPQSRQLLQEYQPSPGSQRSLRFNRSHTLPCEQHPRKLWSLSESGSLVDGDGNDDFSESLKLESEKREPDHEGSRVSLDSVPRILERGDFEDEDESVFTIDLPTPNSLTIVSSPHCQEINETEPLCDSGHVSSWETLSSSSTPPSFVLGGTPLHTDSAVDVSSPQANREKIRPKSGSFGKQKEEVSPFDRARSRSMPNRIPGRERTRRRSNEIVVVSTAHPLYNSGSISLSSISETVLYEAVRSLLT